jgi:hypothetical protein
MLVALSSDDTLKAETGGVDSVDDTRQKHFIAGWGKSLFS